MVEDPLVPLTLDEWEFATRCANAAFSGATPLDAEKVQGRPIYVEGVGEIRLTDTPMNRGSYAAMTALDDHEKGKSFLWRTMCVVPVVMRRRRFKRMINRKDGTIFVPLMKAICTIPGNLGTTERDIEFLLLTEVGRLLEAEGG